MVIVDFQYLNHTFAVVLNEVKDLLGWKDMRMEDV